MRKKMLLRSIPMLLIAGAVGIMISNMNSKQTEDDVNVLPIVIPLAVSALGFGLYGGIKRLKASYESYAITIADNLITREQLNTPTISIYFNDIKEIIRLKNGSFTIKGKEAADLIIVPAQIDNYPQFETALQQIQPIVVKEKISFIEKYQSLAGLVTLGLMFCVYTMNNKRVVALTGSALVVLLIWSVVKIRNSKNVDAKSKRNVWWVIVVLASVIGVMVFKLTGIVDM